MPRDWAEEEFGDVELYDGRLKWRLLTLAHDFFSQPGELVPQAFDGSKAKVKAAYRFFDNRNIDMELLLKPHIESTVGRIKRHKVVLAVQGITTLSYTAHASKDMGPVNAKWNNAVGLMVHDTMAFTEDGIPLGLPDVQCCEMKQEEAGKGALRHSLPIEQKESMKWLKSYRAVEQAQRLCPARTARLAIRFTEIRLDPPKTMKSEPVTMWAVFAQEVEAMKDVKEPIECMLLTAVTTDTFEDACKRIAWYSKRWGIEVYHGTLKSGCRIEDRRLESAERLEACLAIDFVVAWRIYWLTKQGRETPGIPCDVFLSED